MTIGQINDLHASAPFGFVLEPPGLHLHCWTAATGIVIHQAPIGQHPGPFPFIH